MLFEMRIRTFLATVLVACALGAAGMAHAGLLLEPMIGASGGNSSVPLVSSDIVLGFGGGLRFGLEKEDLFSAVETNVQLVNLTGGGSGFDFTFGVTIGGTLRYLPLRFHLGYDFSDSYSDPYLALGGNAIRVGASYFLNEKLTLTAQLFRHIYTGVSPTTAGAAISEIASIGSVTYNSIALSLTLPFPVKTPETPWRDKYHTEN